MPVDSSTSDPNVLPVVAWIRPGSTPGCVRVYIEGDGSSWETRYRVSSDPTPRDPVALRLALSDASSATLLYVGRPCQYLSQMPSACQPKVWTSGRYGREVLSALNAVMTRALGSRPVAVTDLTLVGFSGGGVVAALLVAERDDVNRFITVAAPLDIDHWTRVSRVSPLIESESPMDALDALKTVEQDHFVSDRDRRVPASATERFHAALGPDAPSRLHSIPETRHRDWSMNWGELLDEVPGLCGDVTEGSMRIEEEGRSIDRLDDPSAGPDPA